MFIVKNQDNVKEVPKKKKSSSPVECFDKFTQIPEKDEEVLQEVQEIGESPKAGEPKWEFLHLRPPEDLQNVLASIWESTEETYVVDFSQVLFLKRLIMNECLPLVKYIKDHFKKYFKKKNNKQILLREFQKVYNIFDKDIRNDEEFKAEYHCR